MIPYGKHEILSEDVEAVARVLRSEYLTQGPAVAEFEEQFAHYVGARFAVATNNATTALHISAQVLGTSAGSRVITTPMTFVASSNCVLYCGGEVVFSDINSDDWNLDPNRVEDLLKKNPGTYSGLIPVDYAGMPVRLPEFRELADRHGLWVIEDACHAPGASFEHAGAVQRIGNAKYSEICTFSFHPVKHIATGEGGMITTNNEVLYKKLLRLRSHGITKDPAEMSEYDGGWDMEMQELGYNYRISDILCALGTSQLSRAEASMAKRTRIAARYRAELQDLPIILPAVRPGVTHGYHLFVIRTSKRKDLYDFLRSKGIYSQVHYIPVHEQPYYLNRYGKQSLPNAEAHYRECLSLPMFPSLSEDEQTQVIRAIRDFFKAG